MAETGVILRRDTKANLISNPPVTGEMVFSLDTGEHGWLDETNALIWKKIGETLVMSGFELPSGTAPQGTTYKMLPKPSETSVRTIKYNLDPVDYDGDGEPELYMYSQNQAFSNLWLEGQLVGSLENGPENWVSVGIYANYPVLFFVTQGESRSNTFYFGDYTFTLDPEAYPWTSGDVGEFSMQLLSPLESLPDYGITEPLHHGNSPTEIQNLYDQVYNDIFITENIIEIKTYPMREFVYQDGWVEFNPSRIVTSIPTDESAIEDPIDTIYYVI